jgi:hypothetical protein
LARGMGFVIPSIDFDKIDLLMDIEVARHALYKKQANPIPILEESDKSESKEVISDVPLLEWIDEDSENEKFTLVQSKKKKKGKWKSHWKIQLRCPLLEEVRGQHPHYIEERRSSKILLPAMSLLKEKIGKWIVELKVFLEL